MNDVPAFRSSASHDSPDLIARLAGARLLLIAPHPDDESLALGGLIQHAVRQQARITILQVTDGDNNPWPQRWLERRLRIGPTERQRWGRRRADEMLQAMHQLGLGEASRRRLGWPDMELTARLQTCGTETIHALHGIMRELAPDIVVLPALGDCHPDHAACHVMTRLALCHLPQPPTCLTYHVHGQRLETGRPIPLPLDAALREGKRRAILAHYTQVAMARRRLLARVGETETLHDLPLPAHDIDEALLPREVMLPWRPFRVWHPWLQLTLAHADGVQVWPWRDAPLTVNERGIHLTLPATVRRAPVFARLEMRCTSPWIFDHWGWCDLTAAPVARQADKRTE
ncbi:MAG TPA: PIG-L family deacetylase [Oleiagrimonas sp.]|nr:PIG-L family deacetylase [Oleiagrimonas sp.]